MMKSFKKMFIVGSAALALGAGAIALPSIAFAAGGEVASVEIAVEHDLDLDQLAYLCIRRLPQIRVEPGRLTPDGFLILDSNGKEVRRWFVSAPPTQKVLPFHIKNSHGNVVFISEEITTWCKVKLGSGS